MFDSQYDETTAPVVTVVKTNTTTVIVGTPDGEVHYEQTETTTTTTPIVNAVEEVEEVDDGEEIEGVYLIDVMLLIDTEETFTILGNAIAEYCSNNYASAEVIELNGYVATVRFSSPLLSSIKKIAWVSDLTEEDICWMPL